ncbi:hypothetical protein B0T14DRAFT_146177 [Immersiella caudata]|uniref:DUF7708 domain-containing protein n=1 Tax=Immersiella caudata TaxID=314043 RepID=A0AA39X642_9PEZI|nr:hypothetical protein B0T14DRAFT_146177 [Immersiella caudata]
MDMRDQFRRALDDFKKKAELTSEESRYFQLSSFNDVLMTLDQVQKEQSKKKTLAFMNRIDPFLKTMAEYGKVIEVFVNMSEILAFVWGPMKFLIMVASSFADAFNSLLDIYQQIGEQIPLLESYQQLFSDHVHMRQLLVMIYEDILRVHAIALRYFRQKLWRPLFQSSWKGFAAEIDLLKDNLARHRRLIETRASLVEFEAVQNPRKQSEANFRELKLAEERRRRTAVLQWLSSPGVHSAHERCLEARAWSPTSCHWILADPCFQDWVDPLFCLSVDQREARRR